MRATWIVVVMAILVGVMAVGANAADKQVGLFWFEKSGMAETVTKGFLARMAQKAPNIKIECKMTLPKDEALKTYEEFQNTKDAVVFLRSPGLQVMAKNPPKCPGFFGACSNPVELGAAKSLTAPGGNLTGVTYYLPVAKQLELCKKLFPNMKSLGLLVDGAHPSAAIETAEAKAACQAMNLAYHEASATTKNDLVKAANELKGKCDVMILGNQAVILDNGATAALIADKTPLMSLAEKPIVQKQALGGFVADNEKLGGMLADQVIAVLQDGKNAGEVPVGIDREPKFYLNVTKAAELGLTIPDDVRAVAKIIQ